MHLVSNYESFKGTLLVALCSLVPKNQISKGVISFQDFQRSAFKKKGEKKNLQNFYFDLIK